MRQFAAWLLLACACLFALSAAAQEEIPEPVAKMLDMFKEADAAPDTPADAVIFLREAKVVLQCQVFEKAGRLGDVPYPGYAVFCAVIGCMPCADLMEMVRELEDGTYEIITLKGNGSDTIKRYCYRYHLSPKRQHHDMNMVPEDGRALDDAEYELQRRMDASTYLPGVTACPKRTQRPQEVHNL